MSNKGGYQIIDLQDKNIVTGGSSVLIPGINDLIRGTYKPYLLSGIVIDGVEYDDCYVNINIDTIKCIISVYGADIRINTDDTVLIK